MSLAIDLSAPQDRLDAKRHGAFEVPAPEQLLLLGGPALANHMFSNMH